MKTFIIILTCILCFLLFFNGCVLTVVGDVTTPIPTTPGTLKLISLALVAVYEVVVRVIPTFGEYSAVAWVIRILKKVSDTLNNRN